MFQSSTTDNATPRQIFLVLGAGIVAVSTSAILIRYAQNEEVPSLVIAAVRLLIAAALLTIPTLLRHRDEINNMSRQEMLLAGISGVFLAAHFAVWVTSLEYTSVLISVTLVTTTPIWTALFEVFGLRQPLRRSLLIGLGIALAGGLLIGIESGEPAPLPNSNNLLLGSSLALAGAVTVAVYLVIGRRLRAGLSLLPYIWIVYGVASLVLLGVVWIRDLALFGYSPFAYVCLLGMAVFPQLIGHSSLNYAVKYVSATFVSIATKLEPIGSAVLALILFAEIPGIWQIVGSAIILIGVVIASKRD